MRDYDTRWNISRDLDDARSDILPTGLGLALFDFDHTLPRKYGTGLQAALGLLEECTTPRCDSYKVSQRLHLVCTLFCTLCA